MNNELKNFCAGHGVKLWQVAKAMGIDPSSLSRKFRKEWSEEQKAQFKATVLQIEMKGKE